MSEQIVLEGVHDGRPYRWPELLQGQKMTTLIFTSIQCPYALAYFDTVADYADRFLPQGVRTILIFSNISTAEDREDSEAIRGKFPNPRLHFLRDTDAKLASFLGATSTPHCFLLNEQVRLLWSGPIDSRYRSPALWAEGEPGPWPWDDDQPDAPPEGRLEAVTKKLLADAALSFPTEEPIGCTVKFSEADIL